VDLVRAREKAKAARKKISETPAPAPETLTPPAPAAPAAPPEETPAQGGAAPAGAPAAEAEKPPREIQVTVETPALTAPPTPTEEKPAEPEEIYELLGFTLGREEYGIEIQWVEEIIKPRPLTEVPRAPDYVPGIISLRGKIIPILELGRRLRLPAAGEPRPGKSAAPDPARVIVVSDPESKQPFGLAVGEVTEVIRLPLKELEPPPPTVGGEASFITGVGWVGGKMIIMLNLAELLKLESAGRVSE
jgi:purine-binding chemotaxis protein CheW